MTYRNVQKVNGRKCVDGRSPYPLAGEGGPPRSGGPDGGMKLGELQTVCPLSGGPDGGPTAIRAACSEFPAKRRAGWGVTAPPAPCSAAPSERPTNPQRP